jgi:hypothetical protein
MESFAGDITRFEIEDFVKATGFLTSALNWSQPISMNGYQVWKFKGELKIDPFWKTDCIALSRYDNGSGGKFHHQISGFSCVNPESWAGGMSDAETGDMLSRIKMNF